MKIALIQRPGLTKIPSQRVRPFLAAIARELEVSSGEVSVLLCGDDEMRDLNARMRGLAKPTDVLSFPSGEYPSVSPYIGDIAISLDTAVRQARRGRKSLEREVLTLLAHGFLHLLGYDHESDDGEMLRLQKSLCRRYL